MISEGSTTLRGEGRGEGRGDSEGRGERVNSSYKESRNNETGKSM